MTETTKHPQMSNTVFGEVLAEQLEKRDLEVTPFKVGKLSEEAGMDGWAVISRMANDRKEDVGLLTGLAEKLDLSEPEKMELAVAYIFEERRLS